MAVGSRNLFLETVRKSNAACQNGDYLLAANLYTDALALDPLSHVLYSNRSAARLKMGMFALALQDAVRATELNPDWPKVCNSVIRFNIEKRMTKHFDYDNFYYFRLIIDKG